MKSWMSCKSDNCWCCLLYEGAEMADRSRNCVVTDSHHSIVACLHACCHILCIWSVLFLLPWDSSSFYKLPA